MTEFKGNEEKNKLSYLQKTQLIVKSMDCLEYDTALKLALEAVALDYENAAAYNFIGVINELKGDLTTAIRFYRVAYYIDQTYQPASNNLDRATAFIYTENGIEYEGRTQNEKKD